MSRENKAIVQLQHDEIWSKGILALIDEIYAPNLVCHFIVAPEWRGPDGVKNQARPHRASFPDWNERGEDIMAEGARVVTRFISTGTHRGELAGIAPTGRKVRRQEVAIYRVVGNEIVERWGFPDIHGLMQQLQSPTPQTSPANLLWGEKYVRTSCRWV